VADTPIDERRFTDREVREILKKAVEKGASKSLTSGQGLSLSELKAIGKEVGIDPVRLEEAARAVSQKDRSGSHGLVGAPTALHFYRRVEGEYDPTRTPEVLSIIRHTMGLHGEVSEPRGPVGSS
jgi:hypothetical protein